MPRLFSQFATRTAALWTGIFGLLWAIDQSGLCAGLPGRLNYSLAFLLLAAAIAMSTLHAGKASPSLRAGLAGATLGGLGLFASLQLISPNVLLAYVSGGFMLIGGIWLTASLGREVISRTYLWPLIIVVVGMDSWSVLSPDGVSHQIATQIQATEQFNFMILTLTIPGVGLEPILGIGDALFLGFMAGAVHRLELSQQRFLIGVATGFMLCLGALLIWAVPLPALTFVGPAIAIALGKEAKTTPKEIVSALIFVGLLFALKTAMIG